MNARGIASIRQTRPSRPAPRPGARGLLGDESGASILFALLFFLLAAVVGAVVLTAASVSAGQLQGLAAAEQQRLAAASAAETLGALFEGSGCSLTEGSPVEARFFSDGSEAGSPEVAAGASATSSTAGTSLGSVEQVAAGLVAGVAASGGLEPKSAVLELALEGVPDVRATLTVGRSYDLSLRCESGGAVVLCTVPAAHDGTASTSPSKVLWMSPVLGRPSVAAGTGGAS